MSKQSMREEAERLIRETMERKGHRCEAGQHPHRGDLCGKCGAPNRISAARARPREICLQGMRPQARALENFLNPSLRPVGSQ